MVIFHSYVLLILEIVINCQCPCPSRSSNCNCVIEEGDSFPLSPRPSDSWKSDDHVVCRILLPWSWFFKGCQTSAWPVVPSRLWYWLFSALCGLRSGQSEYGIPQSDDVQNLGLLWIVLCEDMGAWFFFGCARLAHICSRWSLIFLQNPIARWYILSPNCRI